MLPRTINNLPNWILMCQTDSGKSEGKSTEAFQQFKPINFNIHA